MFFLCKTNPKKVTAIIIYYPTIYDLFFSLEFFTISRVIVPKN